MQPQSSIPLKKNAYEKPSVKNIVIIVVVSAVVFGRISKIKQSPKIISTEETIGAIFPAQPIADFDFAFDGT